MADDLLTFELSGGGNTLEVHGNSAGLKRLAEALNRLASGQTSDHCHLLTREWGGDELSSEAQGAAQGDRLLNKVTIHCWSPKA